MQKAGDYYIIQASKFCGVLAMAKVEHEKFKTGQMWYDKLLEELNYLQTVREKEVAEMIKKARSFGDLSENAEYDEAKTEQGKLYHRIAVLKYVIANAEIVEY